MYTVPASVSVNSMTTDPVAGTVVVTTVIPAPGVGNRLRILAYKGMIRRTVVGMIDCTLKQSLAANFYGGFAIGGGANFKGGDSGWARIPYPGIQLPENAGLQMQHTGSAVSLPFRTIVHYVIDSVS